MNDYQIGRTAPAESPESPISRAMSDLAEAVGDLTTAARAVAASASSAIPGGSPFERVEKLAASVNGQSVPTPVRSPLCDQIHTRIAQIRDVTARLHEVRNGIEL